MSSLIHQKTFQGLKTLLHQDCRVCYTQHFKENKLNLPKLANQKKNFLTGVQEPATEVFTPFITKGLTT